MSTNSVSAPEADLLLHCARVMLDDAGRDQVAQLCRKDLDWDLFLTAAESHGLTPLAYWHLKSTSKESVPAEKMQTISDVFMSHVGRNLTLSTELIRLLDLFQLHAITAIPLKGPVLAERCYGNTALRATGDLDLFVSPEAVSTAFRLLREHGYVPCPWRHVKLEDQFFASELFSKLCWEYTFVKEDEGIYVDLHWQLLDAEFLRLSSADLMHSVETSEFQGRSVSVFNDELNLLFLCAHASKHGWYRIGWIVDIAQLLDRMTDVNWDALFDLARTAGVERMLLLGMYLTKYLPGHDLAGDLDQRITPHVKSLGDEIMTRIQRESIASEWKELKKWAFFLSLKPRWSEKVQLFRQLATQPTLDEWICRPLAGTPLWYYRLLRPFNLSTQHVPRVGPRLITGGYDSDLNRRPGR